MIDIDPQVLAGAGHSIRVRCPFHNDTNPSAVFYPDGHFHCFACGAHARSLVDFVRKVEFPDEPYALGMRFAAKFLDAYAPVGRAAAPRGPAFKPSRSREPDPLTIQAMTLFCEAASALLAEAATTTARRVLEELRRRRGLQDPVALGIGLSDERLVPVVRNILGDLGHDPEAVRRALVAAGILNDADHPRPHRYRLGVRVLLPERVGTPRRVIYYQARALGDKPADPERARSYRKYLNPRDLTKPVYGWESMARATDRVWIGEGIFDVLPLLEHGESALATLGAHVTDAQLAMIAKTIMTRQAIIAFDGDDAGQRGGVDLANRLADLGVAAYVLPPLADYHDYGDWLAAQGAANVVAYADFVLPAELRPPAKEES